MTTDFGTEDWFVGTMKGVILGIAPKARLVDITHVTAQGDIRGGAFALMAAASYFPKGTIHVAVIDPGVGSARRALAVKTDRAIFIGPDNGVLCWALRDQKIRSVREIANEAFFHHPVSRTFHGRDIFAPTAAHLVAGRKFSQVGPEVKDWVPLPWPVIRKTKNRLTGEILYIDHFGNAITNLSADLLPESRWQAASVSIKRCKLGVPQSNYASVKTGTPLAIISSSGFLEIAERNGSAASLLKLKVGDTVTVSVPRLEG